MGKEAMVAESHMQQRSLKGALQPYGHRAIAQMEVPWLRKIKYKTYHIIR